MFSFEEALNELNKLYEEDQVCPECGKKECDGSCKKKAGMNKPKLEMINKNPKVSTSELAKVVGDKSKSDSEKAKIIMEDQAIQEAKRGIYKIAIFGTPNEKLLGQSGYLDYYPNQKQLNAYINKAKDLETIEDGVQVQLLEKRVDKNSEPWRCIKILYTSADYKPMLTSR